MAIHGKLGFLGFGNMGYAILRGLLQQNAIDPAQALVYDVNIQRKTQADELGVTFASSVDQLIQSSDIVVLAVKPQSMASAIENIGPDKNRFWISIAAGITVHYLQSMLGDEARIARVMPNTPALVGAGAAGIAMGKHCTEQDQDTARTVFEAVGIAVLVSENEIDAVTALSGSGPAYFFYMVECMIKGAVACGLSEAVATQLAAQTLLGAGRLLAESSENAGTLRENVTSKGGTTEAALRSLENASFAAIVGEAMKAAHERARQLAQ